MNWIVVIELTSMDVSMGSPINKGDAVRFPENRTTVIRECIQGLSGRRASINKYIRMFYTKPDCMLW